MHHSCATLHSPTVGGVTMASLHHLRTDAVKSSCGKYLAFKYLITSTCHEDFFLPPPPLRSTLSLRRITINHAIRNPRPSSFMVVVLSVSYTEGHGLKQRLGQPVRHRRWYRNHRQYRRAISASELRVQRCRIHALPHLPLRNLSGQYCWPHLYVQIFSSSPHSDLNPRSKPCKD